MYDLKYSHVITTLCIGLEEPIDVVDINYLLDYLYHLVITSNQQLIIELFEHIKHKNKIKHLLNLYTYAYPLFIHIYKMELWKVILYVMPYLDLTYKESLFGILTWQYGDNLLHRALLCEQEDVIKAILNCDHTLLFKNNKYGSTPLENYLQTYVKQKTDNSCHINILNIISEYDLTYYIKDRNNVLLDIINSLFDATDKKNIAKIISDNFIKYS